MIKSLIFFQSFKKFRKEIAKKIQFEFFSFKKSIRMQDKWDLITLEHSSVKNIQGNPML